MYTEVYVRCELKKDTPEPVLRALQSMVGALRSDDVDWRAAGLPENIFNAKSRGGSLLGFMCSIGQPRNYLLPLGNDCWVLEARSEVKNYAGEIEIFFEWIKPHLVQEDGEFIGWSLYEETEDSPKLFFAEKRGGET